MKTSINKYINEIFQYSQFDLYKAEDKEFWRFTGDGRGKFEENSNSTTKECLLRYINHCKGQIALAEEYLNIFCE